MTGIEADKKIRDGWLQAWTAISQSRCKERIWKRCWRDTAQRKSIKKQQSKMANR